jgi:hypothetical protein
MKRQLALNLAIKYHEMLEAICIKNGFNKQECIKYLITSEFQKIN